MPTHITTCVVCGGNCYCSNDMHAAGCGGKKGEGGCDNPPFIEFCSETCFHELERRMVASWDNYQRCQTDEES
jgi:hypothetical protein